MAIKKIFGYLNVGSRFDAGSADACPVVDRHASGQEWRAEADGFVFVAEEHA